MTEPAQVHGGSASVSVPPLKVLDRATVESLPNRRHHTALSVAWQAGAQQAKAEVGIGFDDAGRVFEVFADGQKTGSQMEALLDDACILMSFLLQSGWRIADVAEKLKRESVEPTAPAPSIIGQIAAIVARFEEDLQAALAGGEA